jgi:hypothetical protein
MCNLIASSLHLETPAKEMIGILEKILSNRNIRSTFRWAGDFKNSFHASGKKENDM